MNRNRRMHHTGWPPAIGVLLLLGACGQPSEPSVPPTQGAASPRPSTTATVAIASPRPGTVIRDDRIDLVIELDGGTLSETGTRDLRPDQGHLHVLLDEQLVTMTSGLEHTLRDVDPGEHLLKVEFVANDHGFFDPRVLAAVSFTVKSP